MAARKPKAKTRPRARPGSAKPGRPAKRPTSKRTRESDAPTKKRSTGPERRADARLVTRSLALVLAHEDRVGEGERAIGEHLLASYFGGNVALARSKSPTKPMSFAALAERVESETRWDEHDLRRAILVAVVSRSLDARVLSKLTADQTYRLGSIEAVGERRRLAAQIASGEIAGHAVREAIAEAGAGERAGGPPLTPRAVRLARGIGKTIGRIEEDDALMPRALRALAAETKAEIARELDAAADRLRAIERRVRSSE